MTKRKGRITVDQQDAVRENASPRRSEATRADITPSARNPEGSPQDRLSFRLPPHTPQLLLALVAYRLLYVGIMWMSTQLLPKIYAFNNYNANRTFQMHHGDPEMYWHFIPWDAGNYLKLSITGYGPASIARAFYPLWPGLIWLFSKITHGNHIVVAEVLANVITVAACYFLYWYVAEMYNAKVAWRTTVLLLAFPGAVFLALPFSEPVFLLLSTIAILALFKNCSWGAGISGFLVALSRPTGILWAIPIAADVIRKKRYRELWTAALPVAGFGVYLLIMKALTGDAFSGLKIQSVYVAHSSIADLLNPGGFIHALFTGPNIHDIHEPLTSPIDRLWFCVALPLLWPVYKSDKTAFWYALIMTIVPAVTVKFMSYTRFAEMLFPFFVVAAHRSFKTDSEFWYPVVVAAFFALQILFLIRQINFAWVG
ncbi:MAG: hypothetical protein ACLQVD_08100 [Capsulimonadaceae bacterium]